MSTIILQRFANREYRLTNQSILSKPKDGGDKWAERQAEKYAVAVRDTYVLQQELMQGEAALVSDGKLMRRSFGEVDARLGLRALDIIHEFQRDSFRSKNRGGWGFKPRETVFGKNARHRVLEAGAVMDSLYGKNVVEVTCTIPGSGREVFKTVANWSGWIMNRLSQFVRRSKKESAWFYVWELQKRGALHLHFAIGSSSLADAVSLGQQIECKWFDLLLELKDKTGVDVFRKTPTWTWRNSPKEWQSHCLPVYKSVSAYFAKYCSKQARGAGKNAKSYAPARWWGSSRSIKEGIEARRKTYKIETSKSTAKKIEDYLQTWLNDHSRIKNYSYEFQLGKTANGTELGGGLVSINYYTDCGFARMQTWEDIMWSSVMEIAKELGEYEDPTQTWSAADMSCRHHLYADMEQRRHNLSNADMQTHGTSPTPPNQPLPDSRQLSKSRGTQPKATLELRARLLQYLSDGVGETGQQSDPLDRPTEYIQGELFDKNCYGEVDRFMRSYEI